ncbi:hypothetical protein BDV59DRAFT_76171 [Aspergillus ambiguus]|uniref:uncharacterized protein n=1 Tax=Aspergillus ambiguus TaxID=176160 RepID=UPI003CCE100F
MAEKRRLPARERREPAAKRRASEAPPQPQSQASSKKKASTTAVIPSPPPPSTPEVVEKPLPTKLKEGEGLPISRSPQPQNLSSKQYQSIAESAVLLASLERSKKKWLSDGILVRYWTKPKKTKREQIEGKNPPKDTMSKVGACSIVVGPHLFDAMLYTVKDPNAPPPIQYTPPQRPMVHYGHPNSFQQYHHPYPHAHPSQHARQHPQHSPANAASPQPGYHQGGGPSTPSHQARTPNQSQRPPSGPQSAQRPSPAQPAQPAKPSPDPVIQMLATRAASDPELKALMRVVASSKASQEQLRAFQAHIDELNAIIRAREQHQLRQQQQQQQQGRPSTPQSQSSRTPQQAQHAAPPQAPQQTPSQTTAQPSTQPGKNEIQPQNNTTAAKPQQQPQTPAQNQSQEQRFPRVEVQVPKPSPSLVPGSQPSTPNAAVQVQVPPPQKPNTTPQVKQEPGATSSQPISSQQPAPVGGPQSSVKPASPAVQPMPPPQQPPAGPPRPGPQYPAYQQAPYQGHQPPLQSRPPQYGSPVPHYRPAPPPPPRLNYKSVVFEFTSPLTPYGSSTSGHAGSGDRYLFPEYTILEWLPGGNTVLASFLLVRKVDPNAPFPIETGSETGNSRAKGKSSKSKKAKGKEAESEKGKDKEKGKEDGNAQPTGSQNATPAADTKENGAADPKPVDGNADGKTGGEPGTPNPDKDAKKSENLKEYYQPVTFRIHSTNPKVLEPLARVVKPPDEVRKYMNEIMDRAERAPDGFLAFRLPREEQDETEAEDSSTVKKAGTPIPAARSRLSKSRTVGDEESDIENHDHSVEEEEEEELKDYYGAPMGLVPMGV